MCYQDNNTEHNNGNYPNCQIFLRGKTGNKISKKKLYSLQLLFPNVLFCSVFCFVHIYLGMMSILLHWGNQMPFTNKDQGTFAN